MFEPGMQVRISDIQDGVMNALLVLEARKNVPWTKPEDISFDPEEVAAGT